MADTNERLTKLEEARQTIEETLLVMAHLEKRQSEMLKQHAASLTEDQAVMKELRQTLKQQIEKGKDTDERIEKLVSSIGAMILKQ